MHYIIQDAYSGYLYGDTRDLDGKTYHGLTPIEACRLVDESIGAHGRVYAEVPRLDFDTGYILYSVDTDPKGSEAVAVIHDGQDRDTIEAVQRSCAVAAYVTYQEADQ